MTIGRMASLPAHFYGAPSKLCLGGTF